MAGMRCRPHLRDSTDPMASPEIAVLVSSFDRPGHLRRVLASIAAQRGVAGAFEVVVTDDGSRDQTHRLVRQFAASASFPVRFTTHPHDGFQLARCRNEGAAASTAPYLLFLDGDCILPPDHLRTHLDRRRAGHAMAGYYIYLSRELSEELTEHDVWAGNYAARVSLARRLEVKWRHLRAAFYSAIGDPRRPKLLGGNLGIARDDYERVNGYDENFRGWGCEDDDLRLRLRAAGVGVASISWWTNTYHLWHPKAPSAPYTWRAGPNVEYLHRPLRLRRCMAGLTKRRLADLRIEFVGRRPSAETFSTVLPKWCRAALSAQRPSRTRPEIQIAFGSGGGSFSRDVDCRVLIVQRGQMAARDLVQQADVIFADGKLAGTVPTRIFSISSLDAVLQRQLGFQPLHDDDDVFDTSVGPTLTAVA
jgi:glycosyltransferase involved in cell wall biosynthesis